MGSKDFEIFFLSPPHFTFFVFRVLDEQFLKRDMNLVIVILKKTGPTPLLFKLQSHFSKRFEISTSPTPRLRFDVNTRRTFFSSIEMPAR